MALGSKIWRYPDPLIHLRKELREELEEMRNILLNYFDIVIPQLTKDLLEYADELDIAYKSNDKTI